ncbi:MAG: sulfatase-like hydrolase/transferase [Planctomycetes bacterium]|nr:sulfatase-like hydrolase/transferase [Planctomycetota bacterium]
MPITAGLEGVPDGDCRAVLRLCEQLASDSGPARRGLDYCHSLYLEEVLFLDRMLGRLLERIDGSGRETVLLLTGDHGEQFGEHGLAVHANSVYEPLLRVPFFLRGPGFRPGRLAGPPHLRDVVPTFLAAAGLDADPGLGGRDLARELAPRPHVAAQTSMLNQRGEDYPRHLAAARAGGWKLTVAFSREDPRLRPTPLELFDLALDPAELHNLHGERPEVAEQLMAHYLEAAAAWQGPAAADTSADRSEMLRELGYAGDH